ncbi:MAG: HAD family hydrolase [Acidobacteriota bacterium]|jgi:phosphoglycolate phosphatase-like HAD superfamily hydrolase
MMNHISPRTLDAVLFDFDGTLIDASEAICKSFNHALRSVGLAPLPDEEIRRGIGRPLRDIFQEYAPPESLEQVIGAYREAFSRQSIAGSRLISGVASLIPKLAANHALGIVTSRTSGGVHVLMRHFGLEQYFGSVVGVEEVTECKPSAEPVLRALAELDVEPNRSALVGDTVHDMQAACAAGVLPIGVGTGSHSKAELLAAGAERVLDSVADLPELL